MSELTDLPLKADASEETVNEPGVSRRRTPVLFIAIVGLIAGAAGAWWWARERAPAPAAATARTATDTPLAPASEPVKLPPLGQMDIFLRALLGSLSASPELARWLATDDLIRQMAHAIDVVSRGQSPARELGVLRPEGPLQTSGTTRTLSINPASYRRFDGIARAVASLDPTAVAAAYRTIQPRLDEAYRALGRTSLSVDQAVATALQVLIDTPAAADPIRLAPGPGATLGYADPDLQALPAAQKQLIRMGPENAARVKETLRRIKTAIETPAAR
jgi:Protein of unknown function (DUF3014)